MAHGRKEAGFGLVRGFGAVAGGGALLEPPDFVAQRLVLRRCDGPSLFEPGPGAGESRRERDRKGDRRAGPDSERVSRENCACIH